MKIVKHVFLALWTIWCIIGIAGNYSRYKASDWMFIILFVAMPYLILWYLTHRKASREKEFQKTSTSACSTSDMSPIPISHPLNQTIAQSVPKQPTAKAESAARQLESAQKMLNESLNQLNKAISSGNILKTTVQQSDAPSATHKSGPSYIEDDKMIARTDGSQISDEEIPYLIQAGYEKALLAAGKSSSPKHQRTDREEELCVQFMMNHEDEIQKHTASFEEAYRIAYSEKNLNTKIELLQKVIDLYEEEKKWFYKTKGGMIYFEDYYEHMHNSRNEDFSYIDSVSDYLEYNTHKRDYVIPEIINLITSQDGIIQKDIYEYLPDESRSEIQKIISELESDNIISRTKKGNSYFLTLNHQ